METSSANIAQFRMGLKTLSGNAHSAQAGILPGAAWQLVWALGTMKDETGVLVDGLCGNDSKTLNFTEMKIGYTAEGDMTIIPAEAYCVLNIALAEGQTAQEVCAQIRAHLDCHAAPNVNIWPL